MADHNGERDDLVVVVTLVWTDLGEATARQIASIDWGNAWRDVAAGEPTTDEMVSAAGL
jgi:hypothetical protein